MLSSHLWSTLMMWFSFLSASLVMFLLWIKFWVEMLKLINHILTTSFYIMISLLILRLWVIGYLIFYFIIFMISLKREFLRIVITYGLFFILLWSVLMVLFSLANILMFENYQCEYPCDGHELFIVFESLKALFF